MIRADASADLENREGIGEYAARWNWSRGPSASGFTAVLRVKDEARSLPWALPPLLRSVGRLVLVDNGSTDGTPEVAKEAAENEGLSDKLEVLSYPFDVSRCGPEHLETHPDSVRSLAYFYNWSFSHVGSRYALKWDGDMVLTPQGEQVLRDLAWQLEGTDAILRMRRSAVYVQSDRVAYVDLAYTHGELWGWPNTSGHTFIKCFDWEFVVPFEDQRFHLPDDMCFELKWLDADEFGHWSSTAFDKVNMNARKRRDRDLFRATREGAPLPAEVVRVESPGDVHVIDHLRQTFSELRRDRAAAPLRADLPGVRMEPPPITERVATPAPNGRVRHG